MDRFNLGFPTWSCWDGGVRAELGSPAQSGVKLGSCWALKGSVGLGRHCLLVRGLGGITGVKGTFVSGKRKDSIGIHHH